MDFSSFGALAANLASVSQRLPKAVADKLDAQGAAIGATAKSKFGGYQTGWAPLAESTRAERQRLGFAPDDPLFRSGGLRDAVGHKVEGDTVFISIEPGQTLRGLGSSRKGQGRTTSRQSAPRSWLRGRTAKGRMTSWEFLPRYGHQEPTNDPERTWARGHNTAVKRFNFPYDLPLATCSFSRISNALRS